jgi:RNA polymerase sigma-70 factor, ECF subfamily
VLAPETKDSEGKFLAIVNENRPRILRICHAYAWEPEDRKDLYQEVLFQIWRSLPNLKEAAFANTWLYRIALNTAISFSRRQKARRQTTLDFDHHEIVALADAAPRDEADADPRLATLHRAIAALDVLERAIVTMFLEDFSYEQIAEVTGLTSSNVGVRLHRARKKLSTLMEDRRHE